MFYRGRKISAVEVSGDSVMVDWTLGNTCNYSCDYCFPGSNIGTHRMPPLTDLIRGNLLHLINQVRSAERNAGKKLTFVLSGGEPTLYGHLPELLDLLGEHGSSMVLTNGSRTTKWWEDHGHGIGELLISYHVGQANPRHIADVIRIMMRRSLVSLHVMLPPERLDEAARDYMAFVAELDGLPVRISGKVIQRNMRPVQYDADQRRLIESLPRAGRWDRQPPSGNTTLLRFDDGGTVDWDDQTMVKDLIGSFRGYGCFAHSEFISIFDDGSCGVMNCGQRFTRESNLYSDGFREEFTIPRGPMPCSKDVCGCLGLYTTNKIDTGAASVPL